MNIYELTEDELQELESTSISELIRQCLGGKGTLDGILFDRYTI